MTIKYIIEWWLPFAVITAKNNKIVYKFLISSIEKAKKVQEFYDCMEALQNREHSDIIRHVEVEAVKEYLREQWLIE